MPDDSQQKALSQIKDFLQAGHSLDAIREAGWGKWIDHLEAEGYDLRIGEKVIPPPDAAPPAADTFDVESAEVADTAPASKQPAGKQVGRGSWWLVTGILGVISATVTAWWRWAGQRESMRGKVLAFSAPFFILLVAIIVASTVGGGGGGSEPETENAGTGGIPSSGYKDPTVVRATLQAVVQQTAEARPTEGRATVEARIHARETAKARPTATPRLTRTPAPTTTPRPTIAPPYKLALISASCTTRSDIGFSECEGFVKNISGRSMENVEVVVTWVDQNGTPQSTDEALIDFNPVLPEQESPWSTIGRYNPALTRFRVQFKELLGGSILTRDDRN